MLRGDDGGRTLQRGAIAAAKGVHNPIAAAKAMLFDKPVLIAGDGARAFAAQAGLRLCDPDALIAVHDAKRSDAEKRHDTVGCVVLDERGLLATAVSTGGLEGSAAGRVGDSPQPGCGFYCDNNIGGAVFSGDGEEIARMILAARVMYALDDLSPREAVEASLAHLDNIGGEAGGIALTPEGKVGWAHNSDHFAVAYASSDDPSPKVYLSKSEEQNA
ncbi:isoaspartyl peptidase/L-asparaginase [Rhizobium laguerreae]|uniref:isoaspartyl peptidase/L-asparaginase n=1 Tax=Rhizobium laguerreae TaxID=1076926 RepID=UPI001FE278D3|nr:isoaspartyl peptidase/L-asparaginase [Rhizobium laguerreae]